MNSLCESEFVAAIEKETKNHSSRKNRSHCYKEEVNMSQTPRSTWIFKIKHNRSTGETIKFKDCFYADGHTLNL